MSEHTKFVTGFADIVESDIPEEVLGLLLKDHTTGCNILWGTEDYGFGAREEMRLDVICADSSLIKPRVQKAVDLQNKRKRDRAEVFTPRWICNAQNNLIDEAWFGRKEGLFNDGDPDCPNEEKIVFPEGRTWKDYVVDTRLEITCGEAPYLVSRYDVVTNLAEGEKVPTIEIGKRIGMLDRKLRVVGEHCDETGEWLDWARAAFKSIYGYEWQGDSLLLAREALLATFVEYYRAKFGDDPVYKSLRGIAYIVSWNLWQMDGLHGIVPYSNIEQEDAWFVSEAIGIPCKIRAWSEKPRRKEEGPSRIYLFNELSNTSRL